MKDHWTKAFAFIGLCAVLYVFSVLVGLANLPNARASVADAPKYEYKIVRSRTLQLAQELNSTLSLADQVERPSSSDSPDY